MVRHLGINLLEQLVNGGKQLAGRILQRVSHLVFGIQADFLGALFGDQTLASQILFDTCNRVSELLEQVSPLLHLFLASVPLREITGRVVSDTVGNGFDQNRSLLLQDELTGFLGGYVDGKNIVSIDSDRRHAISNASNCDSIASVLVVNGSRNGVHVVSAIEKGLAAEGGGKVKCRMEITLGRGALSEVSHSDSVVSFDAVIVPGARSLRQLSGQGGGHGADVDLLRSVMDGHLLALTEIVSVTRQLVSHLLDGETSPQESTCLTVLGEDQVLALKGSSCANAGSFLAELSHVERDSALSLSGVVDLVSFIHSDHGVVHLEEFLFRNGSVVSWCHDVTLFVHHSETLDLFEGTFELHVSGEGELEKGGVDLIHGSESPGRFLEETLSNSVVKHTS